MIENLDDANAKDSTIDIVLIKRNARCKNIIYINGLIALGILFIFSITPLSDSKYSLLIKTILLIPIIMAIYINPSYSTNVSDNVIKNNISSSIFGRY